MEARRPTRCGRPRKYEERLLAAGPVAVQVLGIGANGHLGFNEPGSSLGSRTRVTTLTEQTRTGNARFFDNDVDAVPRHVITQGLGTILGAEHLVLVATGEGRAAAIAAAVEGPLIAVDPPRRPLRGADDRRAGEGLSGAADRR